MQGKRIPRYPSAVLFYLSTVETSAQTEAEILRFARTPPPAGCMTSDSGWRAQIAAAARLMVADGRGIRRRTAHVADDKGEL